MVLIDCLGPDRLEAVDAIRAIVERRPDTRVVTFVVLSDDDDVADTLRAGACGGLTKDASIDGIAAVVRDRRVRQPD